MNNNHIIGQVMEKHPGLPLCDSSSAKTMSSSLWMPRPFTSLLRKKRGSMYNVIMRLVRATILAVEKQ
jgi:hypothetical protein